MKIEVMWEVMPCRLVRSWSTGMIEASCFPETSVAVFQST